MPLTPAERALPDSPRIFTVRGKRVIIDSDLAELYGVSTKRLNEQVRRNRERFPEDFAFLLSGAEWEIFGLQFASSSGVHGRHRKFLPYAFTEHGVLMAAGVLNSGRAIEVSIYVVRTFVAMREALANTGELARRLDDLEKRIERRLETQDETIAEILRAIRALMTQPEPKRRPIGFIRPDGPDEKG